ncbi:hypothetical protein ACFL6D_01345 [Spirochaetota bacterium]
MQMNKYSILIISIIVGIIFGLPHILIPLLQDGSTSYTPLVVKNVSGHTWDETYLYAAKIRKVYDGDLMVGDIDVYEYLDKPTPFPVFPSFILGLLSHLSGNVVRTFIIGDFLFPALLFIVLYLLIFQFTFNRLTSAACSIVVIFGYHLWLYFPFFSNNNFRKFIVSVLSADGVNRQLEFSRLDTPQFVFILLIIAIYLIIKSINENKKIFSILSGLFFGLLFYSYLYYWTFFFAGTIILLIFYLLLRNKTIFIHIAISLIIGLLISIPYWISYFVFKSAPSALDIVTRSGIEPGKLPYVPWVHIIGLTVFIFLYKKHDHCFCFCVAYFIGGLLCLNIQKIIGYSIQKTHWLYRTSLPWLSLTHIIFLHNLLHVPSNNKTRFYHNIYILLDKFYTLFFYSIIILFMLFGIYTHVRFSLENYQYFYIPDERIEIFNWLNKNTQKNSVVASCSLETDCLLPVYTHNKIFLPCGIRTISSDKEIIERLYATYRLYNVKPSYLSSILDGDSENSYTKLAQFIDNEAAGLVYLFHFTFFNKKYNRYEMPIEIQNKIIENYKSFKNIKPIFEKYKLDYIIDSKYERNIGNGINTNELNIKKIHEADNFTIIQLFHAN